jgi:hypothetical protein
LFGCGHYPRGDLRFYSWIAQESVSALRRVVISLPDLSLLFSFQGLRPLASRRSYPVNLQTSSEPLKRPPLGGPASSPAFMGRLLSSAPSRLSKGPPSSAREVYHPRTGCQQPDPYFRRHVPAFQADLGTTNPSPLGGISLSRFVELLVPLDAGKRRRPRCQRELL